MLITAQAIIAGVLCGLRIKLNAWKKSLSTGEAGRLLGPR